MSAAPNFQRQGPIEAGSVLSPTIRVQGSARISLSRSDSAGFERGEDADSEAGLLRELGTLEE